MKYTVRSYYRVEGKDELAVIETNASTKEEAVKKLVELEEYFIKKCNELKLNYDMVFKASLKAD